MQKRTTLLAGLALGTLLLSGCTGEQNSVTKGAQDINLQVSQERATQEQRDPSISQNDTIFYNGAMQLKDTAYCNKITDQKLKEKCITDISEKGKMDDIIASGNEKSCEQLSDLQVDICKMQIAIAAKNADDVRAMTSEERKIMDTAAKEKTKELCDQIKSEAKRQNCITNVIAQIN